MPLRKRAFDTSLKFNAKSEHTLSFPSDRDSKTNTIKNFPIPRKLSKNNKNFLAKISSDVLE